MRRLEKIESTITRLILQPTVPERLTRSERAFLWLLTRLSHLYQGIMQLRLFLYSKGILRHHTLGCQVISVGNLTFGGTGKTPVVEIFARDLQKRGRRVAILSRGYKKAEPKLGERLRRLLSFGDSYPPRVVSDGCALLLDSLMSGDEPYMLASHLPDVAVLVDKDRIKSGRYAINKLGCDTLILDDGFQHLELKHRLDIVLVDSRNPFGNGHVLPRGILREPVRNIKRASFIFLTKCEGPGPAALKERIRALNPKAEIIECAHKPKYLQNVFTAERRDLGFLAGLKVVALSGIAAPEGFEREIEKQHATVLKRCRFPDHHRYSQQEIIEIINEALRLGADAIITTEKDAVRFPRMDRRDVPMYFLRVDIELLSGTEDFDACISRICFR